MNRFRNGSRLQTGGFLPDLEFAQIRQPVVPLPVEEFGALTGVLNQQFDTGEAEVAEGLAQVTALETSPLEEDRRRGQLLREQISGRFQDIQQQGDFENQVRNIRQVASEFNQGAIPLIQRQQQTQSFIDSVVNDPNIVDKQRVIDAGLTQLNADPNIVQVDGRDVLGALPIEQLQGLQARDVNAQQVFQNAAKGVISRQFPRKRGMGFRLETTPAGQTMVVFRDGTTETIDRDEMEEVLRSELETNPELQSFMSRERNISGLLGEDLDVDAEVENALQSVLSARSGAVRVTENDRFVGGGTGGGSGSDTDVGRITTGNSSGITVSNTNDFRNLDRNVRDLETKVQALPEGSVEREIVQDQLDYFNTVKDSNLNAVKGTLSEDELVAYERYSAFSPEELAQQVQSLTQQAGQSGIRVSEIPEYQNLIEFIQARETIESKVNQSLRETPAITKTTTTLNSPSTGKYSTEIGAGRDLTTEDIRATGFSLIKGFNDDTGSDLNNHLNNNYVDVEVPNRDGEFTYSRLETRPTDGVFIDGNPMVQLSIFGKNEAGEEVLIGGELVGKGNQGWGDYIEDARIAIQDNNPSVVETGQRMLRRASVFPDSRKNERVGSLVARKNITTIPNGSRRKLANLAGEDIYITRNNSGIYRILDESGIAISIPQLQDNPQILSQPFSSEEQLEQLLSIISVKP